VFPECDPNEGPVLPQGEACNPNEPLSPPLTPAGGKRGYYSYGGKGESHGYDTGYGGYYGGKGGKGGY